MLAAATSAGNGRLRCARAGNSQGCSVARAHLIEVEYGADPAHLAKQTRWNSPNRGHLLPTNTPIGPVLDSLIYGAVPERCFHKHLFKFLLYVIMFRNVGPCSFDSFIIVLLNSSIFVVVCVGAHISRRIRIANGRQQFTFELNKRSRQPVLAASREPRAARSGPGTTIFYI